MGLSICEEAHCDTIRLCVGRHSRHWPIVLAPYVGGMLVGTEAYVGGMLGGTGLLSPRRMSGEGMLVGTFSFSIELKFYV